MILNNIKTDNFLSNSEIEHISSIIKYEKNNRDVITSTENGQSLNYQQGEYSIVSPDFGRISLRKIEIGNDLENKFTDYAKFITGLNDLVLVGGVMFTEYSKDYGIPALMPHYDSGEPNILLDYQLYSNIDWSIVIDEIEYKGKDNSVLNIYNTSQLHYRPSKFFNNGDFIGLLFFNFFSKSFQGPKKDNEKANKSRERWKLCQNEVNQKE